MGSNIANDTMLRWSTQLLSTPENDHFEGNSHPVTKNVPGQTKGETQEISLFCYPVTKIFFLRLQMYDTFKVVILSHQGELAGPPQHCTIRNSTSNDSCIIFMVVEQH